MSDNTLTPEKSLQIISESIARSRRDFEKNSGTPMVLWGFVVLVFSIAIWILLRLSDNPMWNFLWFAVPAIGWPLSCIFLKNHEIKGAKNFINETIGQIWIGYGIFASITALVLAFVIPQQIGVIIIALLGYATFMTGAILKNRLITAGGIISGIGGVAALALLRTYDATLVFTAASVVTLIVPGMMMNRKVEK